MEQAIAKTQVKGIVLERDENIAPFVELTQELDRARNIFDSPTITT